MDAEDILHVLDNDGTQTMYLRDGRVVRWSPISGKIYGVVQLPSEEALGAALKKSQEKAAGSSGGAKRFASGSNINV